MPLLEGVAEAALYCAQHSHPPNPERAETRSCPRRAPSINDPSKLARFTFPGMAPVLVPLRPSSEHILIVRAPGARDQHGCHSSPTLCEQEGHLAAPVPSFQARSFSLQGWGLIDLPLRASQSRGPSRAPRVRASTGRSIGPPIPTPLRHPTRPARMESRSACTFPTGLCARGRGSSRRSCGCPPLAPSTDKI